MVCPDGQKFLKNLVKNFYKILKIKFLLKFSNNFSRSDRKTINKKTQAQTDLRSFVS